MPYPTEHAFRLKSPESFDTFRRQNDAGGAGVDFIYGIKDGKAEIQAIRFKLDKWTFANARKWVEEHGYKPIASEPASESRIWKVIRNGGIKVEKALVIEKKSGKII